MIITYIKKTGQITGAHDVHADPAAYVAQHEQNTGGVESARKIGIDGHEWYISPETGALMPRPDANLTVNSTDLSITKGEALTISNVPVGATIRITGPIRGEMIAETSTVEVTFGEPGRYDFEIEAFPFRDLVQTVTVRP